MAIGSREEYCEFGIAVAHVLASYGTVASVITYLLSTSCAADTFVRYSNSRVSAIGTFVRAAAIKNIQKALSSFWHFLAQRNTPLDSS